MGLFDFFKRKSAPKKEKSLPPEALRWNKMWDMWADEEIPSPYQDLMTYQSEVNNGGHSQFFLNVDNTADIESVVKEALSLLPQPLYGNLEAAFSAYKEYDGVDDDKMEEILDNCDDIFYEYEEAINKILEDYSETVEM